VSAHTTFLVLVNLVMACIFGLIVLTGALGL
jgi:hypothetical protein